jgi:hypothetical protein
MRYVRRLVTFLSKLSSLVLVAAAGCGGSADGYVNSVRQEILNGNPESGEPLGQVLLSTGCSGTLIRNDLVLTATHCFPATATTDTPAGSVTVTYGAQTRTGLQIIRHPSLALRAAPPSQGVDVALLRLVSPFVVDGATTGFYIPLYDAAAGSLVGATVKCYGFGLSALTPPYTDPNGCTKSGGGFGSLRSATMTVAASYKTSPAGALLEFVPNGRGPFLST